MAHRYWKACWNMGYAGTDSEEEIDLKDYLEEGKTLDDLTDEEAEDIVSNIACEMALDMIESYAKKSTVEE